jgi:DNA-directed RNA polymerases I, II, and III subunit RPABC2
MSKKTKELKEPKELIKDLDESDVDLEEEEGYENSEFFNADSYNAFIKKNNLQVLDPSLYSNNDVNRVDIITPIDQRITADKMSSAEYTRVVSERAKQIENGATPFVDYGIETDPIKIAEMEILQKKSPLIINRYINKYILEQWTVNELAIPFK